MLIKTVTPIMEMAVSLQAFSAVDQSDGISGAGNSLCGLGLTHGIRKVTDVSELTSGP
jgi:hypothetical protein